MRSRRTSRWTGVVLGAVLAAGALSACAGGGSSPPAAGASGPPSPSASVTATPSATAPAKLPRLVAVTSAGALVTLDPQTGGTLATLVPSGVLGDEVSVSSDGTVYFAARSGNCSTNVESVQLSGGAPVVIAAGDFPAISPDGRQLAYAVEPVLEDGCSYGTDVDTLYHLDIKVMTTGATRTIAMAPPGSTSGLPFPISHLSWAPDGQHLAVSISSVQDNEGWRVSLVDTNVAPPYYVQGTGVSVLPVTGDPDTAHSYLREADYLPDGNLFVSRACCTGFPVHNTSRLMWEVSPSGALVHQVAVGFVSLDHVSLAASADGQWLAYVAGDPAAKAGGDLYLSAGGATPRKVTSGLLAVAFA